MKRILFIFVFVLILNGLFAQSPQFNNTISINQTYTSDCEIFPFTGQIFTGLAVNGNIIFNSDSSLIRLIVIDNSGLEYLIYETYPILDTIWTFTFSEKCEETCYLDYYSANSIKIQIINASISFYNNYINNEVDH